MSSVGDVNAGSQTDDDLGSTRQTARTARDGDSVGAGDCCAPHPQPADSRLIRRSEHSAKTDELTDHQPFLTLCNDRRCISNH